MGETQKGLFQLQGVAIKVKSHPLQKNTIPYLFYSVYMRQLLPAFNQDSPIFPFKKGKLSATTFGEGLRGEKEKDTPQMNSRREHFGLTETSCYFTV